MANPVTISLTLASSISNGIALNQTLGSAAALSINGTLASASIATLDVPRRVLITSAGNDAALSWALVGTDRNGNVQRETFAGATSTSSFSLLDYKTVTSIRSSAATAAGVTAGTNGVGSTEWHCKEFGSMGALGVAIYIATAGPVGNFETTMDDPNAALNVYPYGASVNPQSNIPPIPWPQPNLTNISQSTQGEIGTPWFAWRWTTTSGTLATVIQVIESTWADEER